MSFARKTVFAVEGFGRFHAAAVDLDGAEPSPVRRAARIISNSVQHYKKLRTVTVNT